MEKGFYKEYFDLEQDHWWCRGRSAIILKLVNEHLTAKSKIFDFGCGSGYIVGRLQKLGYDAFGGDFEKQAVNYGTTHGIKNLVLLHNESISYPDASFDAVLALDVMEHLADERPVILEFERVLKPGGVGIIFVPAYEWLWGVEDEVSHHFRRYTVKRLVQIFKDNSSFRVIRQSYFNTLLFLPIAFIRLFSQWLGIKKRESDFEINNKFLNAILFRIFYLEHWLLKITNLPFGVSITLVLKKND